MAVKRLLIIALLGLIVAARPAAAAVPGPLEQVKSTVDAVIATLKDKGLDDAARRAKLASLIKARFDFRVMSQTTLAVNWRRATPAERDRFIVLFTDILKDTYLGRIEAYTDETVAYDKELIKGSRALVDTRIVSDNRDIPMRYRMIREGDRWLVYDVVIEEVSLVNTYRSTYNDIVLNDGIGGLLKKMQAKVQELEGGKK